jgi:hypothetical protein
MRSKTLCKGCDKDRKRAPVHPSCSADREIRSLIVAASPEAAASAAVAAAAVERAKEAARGANPAAVLAALKLLRPQSMFELERNDYVRGNAPRASRKRNSDPVAAAPAEALADDRSVRPKLAAVASPSPLPSISDAIRSTCEAPLGQRNSTNESGTLSRRDCGDPRSFRRGCPDLYFWYRYGWPLLHW